MLYVIYFVTNALIFLAVTASSTVVAEFILWRLFVRGATDVHFVHPLAPRAMHISSMRKMALLTVLHLLFTLGMLCISYLLLW